MTIPVSEIITIGGWVAAGLLTLIGLFNIKQRTIRLENDQTATNLIANLRTTTQVQEKEIIELRAREVVQGKEIAHLQGQVKVLSDILQGRDPEHQAIFKKMPDMFKMTQDNGTAIEKLTSTLNEFMEKLASTFVRQA